MVSLEDIGGIEVAHAAAATVDSVMAGEIRHESSEVLDPGIVIAPEEEINHLLVGLLRRIERMSSVPHIIEEAEDVDVHTQIILDCWDVLNGDWVGDVVESKLMKEVDIVSRSISLISSCEWR